MAKNNGLVSWMLLNVREEAGCGSEVTLDHLYDCYHSHCQAKTIFPATKNILSKVLDNLFPLGQRTYRNVRNTTTNKFNAKAVVYKDLCQVAATKHDTGPGLHVHVHVPDFCEMKSDHSFGIPTEYTVNGKTLYLDVNIDSRDETLEIKLGSLSLDLDAVDFDSRHCQLDQKHVDAILRLCQCMKLCRGWPVNHGPCEQWGYLGKSTVERRRRSTTCKALLSFSAQDTCLPCQKRMQYLKTKISDVLETAQATHTQMPLAALLQNTASSPTVQRGDTSEHLGRNTAMHATHTQMSLSALLQDKDAVTPTVQSRDACENSMADKENNTDNGVDEIVLSEEDHNKMSKIPEEVTPHVTTGFHGLLKSQLQNTTRDPRGRQWDPRVISLCLSVYCRSPGAYSDLKQSGLLVLPSQRLLTYYKNSVDQKPGIVEENLVWMSKEAERLKVPAIGRRGGILLDEMQIQEDIQVKREGDSWTLVGAVDMGPVCNNINVLRKKEKQRKLSTHVLQFVFTGYTGFRWPVCYFASGTAASLKLDVVVGEVRDALDQFGFIVDYVMMDGASTNRSMIKGVLGNMKRPSATTTMEECVSTPDVYTWIADSSTVVYTQDIKHVFKKIRNNLESSKTKNSTGKGRFLVCDTIPIVWEHWEQAYGFNTHGGFRIHRKLTKEHVELTSLTKMRNKLVTDVLDKNMHHLMVEYSKTLENPNVLASTIKLLGHTSALVDLFLDINRPVTCTTDSRLQAGKDALEFFNSWEAEVQKDSKLTSGKNLITQETRDDTNLAVMGFITVSNKLISQSHCITPGYFNSDLVENIFCQQRGMRHGCSSNPTVTQYGPAINAVILGQMAISRKCNSGTKALHFGATTSKPLDGRRAKKRSAENTKKTASAHAKVLRL